MRSVVRELVTHGVKGGIGLSQRLLQERDGRIFHTAVCVRQKNESVRSPRIRAEQALERVQVLANASEQWRRVDEQAAAVPDRNRRQRRTGRLNSQSSMLASGVAGF
jgi:hypothetical protein